MVGIEGVLVPKTPSDQFTNNVFVCFSSFGFWALRVYVCLRCQVRRIKMRLVRGVLIFNICKTHRIDVWYIYLHLVDFYGKCRYIYYTWILWESNIN